MKQLIRCLSLLLFFVFTLGFITPAALAIKNDSQKISLVSEDIDENKKTNLLIEKMDETFFYSFVNETFAYSSQVTSAGMITFSYMYTDSDYGYSSDLLDIDDIYMKYDINSTNDINYEKLNKVIIAHLDDFADVSSVSLIIQASDSKATTQSSEKGGFSTLNAAITDIYGAAYQAKIKAFSLRKYNDVEYRFNCKETQTFSNTSPSYGSVVASAAISVVINFLKLGNWTWAGIGAAFVKTICSTVTINGVLKIAKDQQIQKTDVSCMRTRRITVDGYSETMYWSGWTQKRYFAKGDIGWRGDYSNHYNNKHSDFDDPIGLIDSGYNYFINYVV